MPLDQQQIEEKLLWLADIEEIKQLKARYAAACDADYDADAIVALFTEDAVWDGGMMGYAETRDGIHRFFEAAPNVVGFAVHGISNPIIEIDGDTATGAWYLWEPIVMVRESQSSALWMAATYDDRYVRAGDAWLFEHVKVNLRMLSPYEEGFAKTRFVTFE